MRIGIFDPYLDTIGGGERYVLIIASHLSKKGHQVDVFWNDASLKKELTERLGIKLDKINFVEDIFSSKTNLYQKWQITNRYGAIFFLSDGSIPFLFGKRNFLLFLVPFTNVNGRSLLNKAKLKKFQEIIAISKFTKKYIDQEYGVRSKVIYPPAAVREFKPRTKKNLIISVGRFSQILHAKKQEILIKSFEQIYKKGLKEWQLVLVGGAKDEDKTYVKKLKKMKKDLPIEILVNINFPKLQKLYGEAKIYWHAAGFGEDEKKHPERMEHFGITTVEAMSAGTVPVVIDKGGQPEIIKHQTSGLLWRTKTELEKQTLQLIKSPNRWQKLSSQAMKDSQKFSQKVFCQKIDELIKE